MMAPFTADDAAKIAGRRADADSVEKGLVGSTDYRALVRTDRWLEFADGVYRFNLPTREIEEVERLCSRKNDRGAPEDWALPSIYGAVAAGRYELDGESVRFPVEGRASPVHLRHVVRMALQGGGVAVIDGKVVPVTPEDATRLVGLYLDPACVPATRAWDIAFAVLGAAIEGREATDAEREHGHKSIVPPSFAEPIGELISVTGRVKLNG